MADKPGGPLSFPPIRRARPRLLVAAAVTAILAVATTATVFATALPKAAASTSSTTAPPTCSRQCMTVIVDKVLASMVRHDPATLPLAPLYEATENMHPAALGMMELWRTVTAAGRPSLLAIDTANESAYFALDVTEGNSQAQSILWGWIKVVGGKITQLCLFVNRSRGDHGFSFSATELAGNYQRWMSPPAGRTRASRATLVELGAAQWNTSVDFTPVVAADCQFSEMGWSVVDPGDSGTGSTTPLGCAWPAQRPTDAHSQVVVADPVLGIVVSEGVVPGKVFPYPYFGRMISAFIPDQMTAAQQAQWDWLKKEESTPGALPMLEPMAATGMTLRVDQYYDGELQGDQIDVNLGGPDEESLWEG